MPRSRADLDEELLRDALAATRPSRKVAFKRTFAASAPGDWCELLKDVAAMANSGGGVIVIGLESDGTPSGWDPAPFLATDIADVTKAFSKYLGEQLADLEIRAIEKDGQNLAALLIRARVGSPLVFEKAGTYADGAGRQTTAFARGTTYFRHGARSEPGNARDLARFVEREVQRQRRAWLTNIRKVAAAPTSAQVLVVATKEPPSVSLPVVRVVDEPSAPALARTDFDTTHPYRQKDVLRLFNAEVEGVSINQFDMRCVRRVHGIDARPEFFHMPRYSSAQYSRAFVDWLIEQHERDPEFFADAKAEYRARERA
jgi:hypothetical protein